MRARLPVEPGYLGGALGCIQPAVNVTSEFIDRIEIVADEILRTNFEAKFLLDIGDQFHEADRINDRLFEEGGIVVISESIAEKHILSYVLPNVFLDIHICLLVIS